MPGNDNTIKTIQPDGKVGIPIERGAYEAIKSYMLKILDHGNSLDITSFIDLAHEKFEPTHRASTGMMIYSVKRDLEARGLIYHEYPTRKVSSTRLAHTQTDKTDGQTDDIYAFERTAPKINEGVQTKFIELFTKHPLIVQAPGRINVIGDHTDYNEGLVMPASISKNTQFALAASNNTNSLIYSNRFNEFLSIDNRGPLKRLKNSKWQNYLIGILQKLKMDGIKLKPFNCVFDGDLPIGSGLASSASLACSFIVGLNELFHLNLSKLKMIETVHWSENNFVKVECGIMDPFVSIMGKEGSLILLDCKTKEYTYHELKLAGFCFLLCDTNIKHSHPTSIFNKRFEECALAIQKIATAIPSIKSLRDVTEDILEESKALLNPKLLKRCRFVIQENKRVEQAQTFILTDDAVNLGKTMFESHSGLSSLFDVSCDELDFLVELAKNQDGLLGARMMGGGFGGCTLNLIKNDSVGPFIQYAQNAYKHKFNMGLQCHIVQLGEGASVLENPAKLRRI